MRRNHFHQLKPRTGKSLGGLGLQLLVNEKKLPSLTKALYRKSPRGLGPKIAGQGDEEYNEEGDDMDTGEGNKEEEDVKREEPVAKN